MTNGVYLYRTVVRLNGREFVAGRTTKADHTKEG